MDQPQVPWKQASEKPLVPGLQRLREHCVVGVGEYALADRPRIVPLQLFLIHQQSHQLRNGYRGMCIVQLDLHLVRQIPEAAALDSVAVQDVLQGSGNKKELLFQPQLLPFPVSSGGYNTLEMVSPCVFASTAAR